MDEKMLELASRLRETIDWAVDEGLTKIEIMSELEEAMDIVQGDDEIPSL